MDTLALVCEDVARWNSRLKKIAVLAAYLRTLDDDDLARAVRFLCCGPVFEGGGKISIGSATIRQALIEATGWDAQTVGICYREVGDSGETACLLVEGHSVNEPMTLASAEILYARLHKCRGAAAKAELLREILSRHRPLTVKYFLKVITGNLRIGLLARTVEEAVTAATASPPDAVRLANNRLGDLARVAVAARHGTLDSIQARLFHPMDFMLAKPLDALDDLADPGEYYVEDKYDGIRSQVHVADGRVLIFSRGLENITPAFPDIAATFRDLAEPAVLDGEILAWRDGRALPFNVLQQRLARKSVAASLVEEIPAVFMAYDVLYAGGRMTVDDPLEQRYQVLARLLSDPPPGIRVSGPVTAASTSEIDRYFEEARARGNEGLVLKRRSSLYEPGRRSGAWLKVKRPYGTLDVVITAAEQGHGRRAVFLSDYTFAVRAGDGFVNVGKAYSGLTDAEVRELTRLLRGLATDRFGGRVLLVRPQVVLEVAFDGVQKSPRHKGGYALRFPRIVRWRRDKAPEDCDTIENVRALYEASLRT